jgi:SAM-dependent methyltransferase
VAEPRRVPIVRPIEPRDVLGDVHGGRVLDVATGAGGFVQFLVDGLGDFAEIIGIDISSDRRGAFEAAFPGTSSIRFELMDAGSMTFASASFDTVAISDSLHHLPDPVAVLREVLRVLRPEGNLVVSEMYRDGQTPPQMTHVELHHWAAAINRMEGTFHRDTYTRAELVQLLSGLPVHRVRTFDRADTSDDPRDPETVEAQEAVIARYLARAAGREDLERRGQAIRDRLRDVGIHGATELVYRGSKDASA